MKKLIDHIYAKNSTIVKSLGKAGVNQSLASAIFKQAAFSHDYSLQSREDKLSTLKVLEDNVEAKDRFTPALPSDATIVSFLA